ncbi:hypothetical protein HPP92_019824 [Vanilla planifolia]|uniref:Hydantoinase/oxoprolinase N-terminal domain-containing protein n=1 Tax=Vanilla planifolia TaxID=51239 RepID=A0A835Q3X7_VANPL|nr:hypothetical protein HPP92_019824 [Vanilla planifolia]
MGSTQEEKFRFCIDRGGTFTDIYAEVPGRDCCVMKLLSVDPANYDDAPIEGIRRILEEYTEDKIPDLSRFPQTRLNGSVWGLLLLRMLSLKEKERIALCVTRVSRICFKLETKLDQIYLTLEFQSLLISMKR